MISDDLSDTRRQKKEKKKSLFRVQNAIVLSSIFQGLGNDDRQTAYGYQEAVLLVRYLKHKYKKILESTIQDYISEFYDYKIKDQNIRIAHIELKNLARKIKKYDSHFGIIMISKYIFNRLISVLPKEFVILEYILYI